MPTLQALQGNVGGLGILKNSGSPVNSDKIIIRGTSTISATNKPLYVVDGVPVGHLSSTEINFGNSINDINPEDIAEIEVLNSASASALYGSRAANGVILVTIKNGSFIDNSITEEIDIAYKVDAPVTVLSGKPVATFDIKSTQVKVEYMYKCAPSWNKNVFTVAKVANWESLKLLDGETNLFYQLTYIGTSHLNTKLTSDTLDFNLGKDNNIVVNRKTLPDFSKNQFAGNKRVVNNEYEIEIRNNKNKAIKLELFDQIPLSTDKQITIEVEETSNANYNAKTGILKWNLELAPSKTKKLMVKYVVRYPKGRVVEVK